MGSGSLCPGGRLAWSQCPHTLQASALCLQSCRSLDLQTRAHYLVEGTDRKASLSSRLSLFFLTPLCSLGYRLSGPPLLPRGPAPVGRTPSSGRKEPLSGPGNSTAEARWQSCACTVCSTEASGSGPAFHLLLSQLDPCPAPHASCVCWSQAFRGASSCALTRRRCPCTAQRSSLCSPAHRHPEIAPPNTAPCGGAAGGKRLWAGRGRTLSVCCWPTLRLWARPFIDGLGFLHKIRALCISDSETMILIMTQGGEKCTRAPAWGRSTPQGKCAKAAIGQLFLQRRQVQASPCPAQFSEALQSPGA